MKLDASAPPCSNVACQEKDARDLLFKILYLNKQLSEQNS